MVMKSNLIWCDTVSITIHTYVFYVSQLASTTT